ncbi:MAG: hypothetical protein JXB49_04895 [Bacteroidales bacterium]|nr:hypothetical protein [Bacteroidales bacterium]
MRKFVLKFLAISTILSLIIIRIEYTDAWNSVQSSEQYVYARWNSLYDLTRRGDIDILLMGNSRIYNGINPKRLSIGTSSIAFIMGAPGTTLADNYFSFKEILKRTKPKILIMETYCINYYDKKNSDPLNIIKSFRARKNFWSKIESMPSLFQLNHWPYAWLHSIRNHNNIFDEEHSLKETKEENKKLKELVNKGRDKMYMGKYKLYLGKYNGNTGLSKETLKRYEEEGPSDDAANRTISRYNKRYLKKLNRLCKKNDVELMFITIPVYYKHIKNWDKAKKVLSDEIDKTGRKWLDFQAIYDTNYFKPIHFDNTYSQNQHTTAEGSYACTGKLIKFLHEEYPNLLPDRSGEQKWREMFYGQEDYFIYYPVADNDTKNKILLKNIVVNNVVFEEIGYSPVNANVSTLWAKVKSNSSISKLLYNRSLLLSGIVNFNNTQQPVNISLQNNPYYENEEFMVFTTYIKPMQFLQISNLQFY